MNSAIILDSIICCPTCGHSQLETMPTNACQWFYECKACRVLLKPLKGDCCVYCSYGTVACPPVQQRGRSCCTPELTTEYISKRRGTSDLHR